MIQYGRWPADPSVILKEILNYIRDALDLAVG
jgi:hypothetical protein